MPRKKRSFYSPHGWEGEKYNPSLSTKEIARLIRKEIKQRFPDIKVSVRTKTYTGGSSITVTIKDLPFNPIQPDYDPQNPPRTLGWKEKKYVPEFIRLEREIQKIGNQYRYDDSDAMVDYFDTNFYYFVELDYDREQEWIEERKRERVLFTSSQNDAKQEKKVGDLPKNKQDDSPERHIADIQVFQNIAMKILEKGGRVVVTGMNTEEGTIEFQIDLADETDIEEAVEEGVVSFLNRDK